ncbi:MAG: helix-turn-helix transcriptional regulator [Clostridia bacterium]|nr:helix-turn-helix transcriptional regulator [Clostridia bacterium]
MLTGEIINRKEFWVKSGSHPRDSLIIVLEGSFRCTISGISYLASPRDICVFRGGTYFERAVISPITCIYVQLDALPFAAVDGIMPIHDRVRKNNTIQYLEQAIKEQQLALTKHLVEDIFLIHAYEQGNHYTCTDDIVSGCIDFLEKNYSTKIHLDELANHFHISKQWLISKFKKHVKKTPIQYLQDIRLQYGKELLRDTDLPVGEIAAACGFENVYYFSSSFKRSIGLSPLEYRKKQQL